MGAKGRTCEVDNAFESRFLPTEQCSLNRVQHDAKFYHVFGKKAKHEIAVLLEQLILAGSRR